VEQTVTGRSRFPLKTKDSLYIQLNSNKGLKKLIEDQPYLNEEEITLKKELEASIGKLFQFYDEFYKHKLNRVQTDFKSITEFKPNLSLWFI